MIPIVWILWSLINRSFVSLCCAKLCFMVKFNTNHQAVRSRQIIFGYWMTIDILLLLCSGNSTWSVIFKAHQKNKLQNNLPTYVQNIRSVILLLFGSNSRPSFQSFTMLKWLALKRSSTQIWIHLAMLYNIVFT